MIELGTFNGKKVYKVAITNGELSANVVSYGASLSKLIFNGVDVVLGFDTLEEYLNDTASIGRTIGRVCNRIKDAKFTLNGKEYNLTKNSGENCLHGGNNGLGKKVWDIVDQKENSVTMQCVCLDNEDGFPGNLTVQTTYSITDDNGLQTEHKAWCDKDTIVSITNHSYFNLNGHGEGNVLNHRLKIDSNTITPVDSSLCPFNTFMDIKGGVFDFSEFKEIGKDIEKDDALLKICNGYDHNYMIDGDFSKPIATIVGDKTGITMQVFTDQKGIHLYTANFLKEKQGKGKTYDKRHAVCFETQCPPNAINCDKYPSPILKKGEIYSAKTKYKFI